jgi:hypothetical protein
MVLHTWGQRCSTIRTSTASSPMGGLAPDGTRWIHARPRFFLPIEGPAEAVSRQARRRAPGAFRDGRLAPGTSTAEPTNPPFGAWLRIALSPDVGRVRQAALWQPGHVLHYLARYTHRVAISNHRLVDVTDDTVSFRWKDYRHGSQVRTLTLSAEEFLRRFLCTCCRSASSGSATSASSPRAVGRRSSRSAVRPWPSRRPPPPRTAASRTRRGHRGRVPAVAAPCARRTPHRTTTLLEALLADILHDTS